MLEEIIEQQERTEAELLAAGFQYYERKKQLVMTRVLPEEEAPMTIVLSWDTLIAEAGYIICYDPGEVLQPTREDYHHWTVHPDIFAATYREWNDINWRPSPTEKHLMDLGCKPHFKYAGIWAKRLEKPTYIRSLESAGTPLIPAGAWLAIGVQNAPWHIEDADFRARYVLAEDL